MGIEHRRTTPYHPESNGKMERLNKTVKGMLRKLVNGSRADWEDQLGAALSAYRISTSTVKGHSPFMLYHVRPPRYPLLVDTFIIDKLGGRQLHHFDLLPGRSFNRI